MDLNAVAAELRTRAKQPGAWRTVVVTRHPNRRRSQPIATAHMGMDVAFTG